MKEHGATLVVSQKPLEPGLTGTVTVMLLKGVEVVPRDSAVDHRTRLPRLAADLNVVIECIHTPPPPTVGVVITRDICL